jgi:hypothetical protein
VARVRIGNGVDCGLTDRPGPGSRGRGLFGRSSVWDQPERPLSSSGGSFLPWNVRRIRTVEGSITNNGFIRADFSLKVTGNYTQASGAELFEEWPQGTIAPGELAQGLLNVNGNATLSGYLVVGTDAPKHPSKSGSTYTVMTFGSLSGKFTSVSTGISAKYNQNSVVAKYQ